MAKGNIGFAWEVPRLASFCILQRSFVVYVELSTISFSQIERALTRFLENRLPSFCQGDRLMAPSNQRPATIQFRFPLGKTSGAALAGELHCPRNVFRAQPGATEGAPPPSKGPGASRVPGSGAAPCGLRRLDNRNSQVILLRPTGI
jgi:hypothetical protein